MFQCQSSLTPHRKQICSGAHNGPSSVAAQEEAVRGNYGESVAKPCGDLGIQGQGKKEEMLKLEVRQRGGRAKRRKQCEKVGEAKLV